MFARIRWLRIYKTKKWQRLTGSEKCVLTALLIRAHAASWECWPSYRQIAEAIGLEKRTIQKAVGGLKTKRAIRIVDHENGRRMRFNLSRWDMKRPGTKMHPVLLNVNQK